MKTELVSVVVMSFMMMAYCGCGQKCAQGHDCDKHNCEMQGCEMQGCADKACEKSDCDKKDCKTKKNECMNECKMKECGGNDFLQLAADRYSVRSFSNQPVEQEKIDKILEAGKLAPTAVNSQPQLIYVLKSPEAMEKANKLSRCIYGAPQTFIICYDDNRVCSRGEKGNYGDIDCTIVLTHMMLEAWNIGIGTCMVGMFNPDEVRQVLELPDNIHPVLMMPFGYPAEDAAPSARHTEYRPLEETVQYL